MRACGPSRGQHHAQHCNLSKQARWGLMVYELCLSDGPEAGYTAAFKIYTGQDHGEFPTTMKAVIDLMEKAELFDKGYELHTDNRYSSPTLFNYLQARKTSTVGTVCTNRKGMLLYLQASQRDIDFCSTPTRMLCLH